MYMCAKPIFCHARYFEIMSKLFSVELAGCNHHLKKKGVEACALQCKFTAIQRFFLCSIHPRYKETVGARLAVAGLSQAYNFTTKSHGPVPTTIKTANKSIQIVYDEGKTALSIRNIRGFEVRKCLVHS